MNYIIIKYYKVTQDYKLALWSKDISVNIRKWYSRNHVKKWASFFNT